MGDWPLWGAILFSLTPIFVPILVLLARIVFFFFWFKSGRA